jgi:hypothetical protein
LGIQISHAKRLLLDERAVCTCNGRGPTCAHPHPLPRTRDSADPPQSGFGTSSIMASIRMMVSGARNRPGPTLGHACASLHARVRGRGSVRIELHFVHTVHVPQVLCAPQPRLPPRRAPLTSLFTPLSDSARVVIHTCFIQSLRAVCTPRPVLCDRVHLICLGPTACMDAKTLIVRVRGPCGNPSPRSPPPNTCGKSTQVSCSRAFVDSRDQSKTVRAPVKVTFVWSWGV